MRRSAHNLLKSASFAPHSRGMRITLALLIGFLPVLHSHHSESAGHPVVTADICDAAPSMSATHEIALESDDCPVCNLLRDGVSTSAAPICLAHPDLLAHTTLTPQRVGMALDHSSPAAPRAPPV